jgi:uncharacterized membrane protein YqaE (UPF0057 family)
LYNTPNLRTDRCPPLSSPPLMFEIGSGFLPRLAWIVLLLLVLSCIPGMIGVHHYTQPLVMMWSCEPMSLSPSASNGDPSDFHLQNTRITGFSHCAQPRCSVYFILQESKSKSTVITFFIQKIISLACTYATKSFWQIR